MNIDIPMLDKITIGTGCDAPQTITAETPASAMQWVAVLAGEPWSRQPKCASPIVTAWMRAINGVLDEDYVVDAQALRTSLLRPLIPRIIGSRGADEVEAIRRYIGIDFLVRQAAPMALEAIGLPNRAQTLRDLPEINSGNPLPYSHVQKARDEALHLDPPLPGDELNDWERGLDAGHSLELMPQTSGTDYYNIHEVLRFLLYAMSEGTSPTSEIRICQAAVRCVESMLTVGAG